MRIKTREFLNTTILLLIIWLQLFCLRGVLCAQAFRDVSEAVGFPRTHKISSWLDVLTIGHLGPKTGSITQLWRNDLEAKTLTGLGVKIYRSYRVDNDWPTKAIGSFPW